MEIVEEPTGVRAIDESKTSIAVDSPAWTARDGGPSLPRPTDAVVRGEARRLEFPPVLAFVTDLASGESFELGASDSELDLPAGRYVMRLEAPIKTFVRFDGPARVSGPRHERVLLSMPETRPLTLGFRSHVESATDTMTVPRTPEGVATALSFLPTGHRTVSPDRSFPSMRGHPPLVTFGETTHVPDTVERERRDTGVSFRLPPDLRYLLSSASLSQYLGADVETVPGATPTLRLGDEALTLPGDEGFERAVSDLLRRVFWLDCLVREAGPHGRPVMERDVLDTLSLDADTLYEASIPERVRTYLAVDFEAVADRFPEWHLALYPAPTYENAAALPYVVQDLPLLYPPRVSSLQGRDRLSGSLDDFYRGAGEVASVDLMQADLGAGRYHGWLGEGIPVDVFKSLPAAYENRAGYRDRDSDSVSVVAVLNDSEMDEEHTEAARIYRQRAEDLDFDIDVHERLTTDELAELFETDHDLVHYIGHCETGGLRCPDGYLSASSLSESNAQTFFLNACGSYHEGLELIRKGSVAGAVTFDRVLDRQAARVGTMFARLLVHGYSIERALDLSSRRIIMSKDYAVVGDGTHVLTQTEDLVGPEAKLERREDGEFDLTYSMFASWAWGADMQVWLDAADRPGLLGQEFEFRLSRPEVVQFLSQGETPVVYEGDIHWSTDLVDLLKGEGSVRDHW